MARPRTGNLVPKPSGFFARVWVKLPDGTEERRFINLQTKDRSSARRKLARVVAMIAAGEVVAEAEAKATAPETYKAFTLDRNAKRKAAGVVMAPDEQRNREQFIYPTIGDKPLARVTDDHVRQILEDAAEAGMAWETVKKIRAVMARDFKRARIEKMIAISPVQDVALPEGLKKDKRPRTLLSDAEVATYLAAQGCDLEVKMLSLTARTEGGMRSAELIRWDWTMLDLVNFASCRVRRAKTHDVQTLEIPDMLRPFLRAWWERAGSPVAGPVFPARRGKRRGQARRRGTSFAKRLRRELFKAGVVRLPPIQVPATTPGMRTDLKKATKGTKPAPNPADPLYFDTPVSRCVDFHSFRRA